MKKLNPITSDVVSFSVSVVLVGVLVTLILLQAEFSVPFFVVMHPLLIFVVYRMEFRNIYYKFLGKGISRIFSVIFIGILSFTLTGIPVTTFQIWCGILQAGIGMTVFFLIPEYRRIGVRD